MFDVIAHLEIALDKASRSEVPLDVTRLRTVIDRAEALWVRSVGAAERAGEWQAEGFVSSAAWLREKCRLAPGDAASTVKLARTLDAMPALAEAFAAGEISRRHAQVVSCARTPERRAVFDELDETLTNAARTLKPHDLRRVVQRATDAIDGDGGASRDRAQYAQRGLHISDGLDGTAYGAMTLEPEG